MRGFVGGGAYNQGVSSVLAPGNLQVSVRHCGFYKTRVQFPLSHIAIYNGGRES